MNWKLWSFLSVGGGLILLLIFVVWSNDSARFSVLNGDYFNVGSIILDSWKYVFNLIITTVTTVLNGIKIMYNIVDSLISGIYSIISSILAFFGISSEVVEQTFGTGGGFTGGGFGGGGGFSWFIRG